MEMNRRIYVAAHWRCQRSGVDEPRALRREAHVASRDTRIGSRRRKRPRRSPRSPLLPLREPVFCFTPKGEDHQPRAHGSTPLDFAYAYIPRWKPLRRRQGQRIDRPDHVRTAVDGRPRRDPHAEERGASRRDWLSIVNTPRRSRFARCCQDHRGFCDDLERGRDYIVREAQERATLCGGGDGARVCRRWPPRSITRCGDMYIAVGAGNLSPKQVLYRATHTQQDERGGVRATALPRSGTWRSLTSHRRPPEQAQAARSPRVNKEPVSSSRGLTTSSMNVALLQSAARRRDHRLHHARADAAMIVPGRLSQCR